jgi:hypothetical protein
MPLDGTGYPTEWSDDAADADDLAALKVVRHRLRHRWRWGKWRGELAPSFARHCVLTAIPRRYPMSIITRLQAQLPPGCRTIDGFNDAPETTHADVLALIDRAIAVLETKA